MRHITRQRYLEASNCPGSARVAPGEILLPGRRKARRQAIDVACADHGPIDLTARGWIGVGVARIGVIGAAAGSSG